MGLEDDVRRFGRRFPAPADWPGGATSSGDSTWDQDCAAFCFRFGVFTTSPWVPRVTGPTAWDVALASGDHNSDATDCPPGGFHWWKGKTRSKPGHVMIDIDGGGTRVAGATKAVSDEAAPALGFSSVATYSALRPAMVYSGWTATYAGAALVGLSQARIMAHRIRLRRRSMDLTWDTAGVGYLRTDFGIGGIPTPEVYNLFWRQINSDQSRSPFVNGSRPETFNPVEIGIMNTMLRLIASAALPGVPPIDAKELAAAITAALPGGLSVSAPLPDALRLKIDAIEAGDPDIELTKADFATNSPVTMEQIADALDAVAPAISDSRRGPVR